MVSCACSCEDRGCKTCCYCGREFIASASRTSELEEALKKVLPALIWYFKGPYGRPPEPADLAAVQTALRIEVTAHDDDGRKTETL